MCVASPGAACSNQRCMLYGISSSDHRFGTSTWRNKKNGLRAFPPENDVMWLLAASFPGTTHLNLSFPLPPAFISRSSSQAYRFRRNVSQLQGEFDSEEEYYDEIDRIGNVFNRLLIFKSGLYHR